MSAAALLPPASNMVVGETVLQHLASADEALYCAIYTDEALMRQVAPALNPEAARRAFAAALRANADSGAAARYWSLSDRISACPVGVLGVVLAKSSKGELQAEVGAMILAEWQGKGHAASAIRAVAAWLFVESRVQRLHTRHAGSNLSADGLMRKLGFAPVPEQQAPDARHCRWELRRDHWTGPVLTAPGNSSLLNQQLQSVSDPISCCTLPACSQVGAAGTGFPTVQSHSSENRGTLVCVGLGITLGAHLSPRSRSYIEQADVVFAAVSDPLVEVWLRQMHSDVRSLQSHYAEGKSRHATYREMSDAMLAEVRLGKRVCGAFYGHPGVFAMAPHRAIELARAEGHQAHMEPGISAEDCLYADLGIDPGRFGCQHHEASQLMIYQRRIDASAYLILWQVGVAGDFASRKLETHPAYVQLLVELLAEDYPLQHPVTVYEAATLAIAAPRIEIVALCDLPSTPLGLQSTLVFPPARAMASNVVMKSKLEALEKQLSAA